MDGTVKFHKVSSWESCLMGWFMNIYEYLGHVWPTAGPASWHEIPFCATRATCLQDARCSFNIILGMRNSLRLPSGWKLRIAGDRSKLWGRLPHSHRCTQWYTMCERRFSLSSEWKDWNDTNLASRARASCTAGKVLVVWWYKLLSCSQTAEVFADTSTPYSPAMALLARSSRISRCRDKTKCHIES